MVAAGYRSARPPARGDITAALAPVGDHGLDRPVASGSAYSSSALSG